MIRAAFERNAQGQLVGYTAKGHSGYAEQGADIVCAGASILALTCVNSLEALCGLSTDDTVIALDEEKGVLAFRLPERLDKNTAHDAQLLMSALALGMQDMAEQYPEYLQVSTHRSN